MGKFFKVLLTTIFHLKNLKLMRKFSFKMWLLAILVRSISTKIRVAHWYPAGFLFHGTAVQIPVGEEIFHLLFLRRYLMIAIYLCIYS